MLNTSKFFNGFNKNELSSNVKHMILSNVLKLFFSLKGVRQKSRENIFISCQRLQLSEMHSNG